MPNRKRFGYFLISSLFTHSVLADVNQYMESIKSSPNALYAFFKEMPKGGELHYHLAGGAYPEVMLDLAAKENHCLDKYTFALSKGKEVCNGTQTKDIFKHPEIYHKTIRAWSLKDFVPGEESAHDHFFASFYKFIPILAEFRPQLLASIMRTAASQHNLYLEIMVLPDNARSASFATLISQATTYQEKQRILLENQEFQDNIKFTRQESDRIINVARQVLGCDKHPEQAACEVKVKFLYYILREQPVDNVFAQALNAFNSALESPEIVGINLVQAEDDIISTRDYREHMKIIRFLHEAYPKVHISLHAGELSPASVKPDDLRFHIHDAIFTGQAERIGHGVSVAYEDEAEKLVQYMAEKQIPVEINLISNREILNVSGADHPLGYYLAHKVPVVLSSDDEGVLRTDLTRQYVDATFNHNLNYQTLKNINRNALTYSFIPGKNLWANLAKYTLVEPCLDLQSPTCLVFVKDSEKAQLQRELEIRLIAFEKQFDAK